MKEFISLVSVFLLLISCGEKQRDLLRHNLKGKVKSITYSNFKAVEQFGKAEQKELKWFEKSEYDSSTGNIVKRELYDLNEDGAIKSKTISIYDINDKETEVLQFDENGTIRSKNVYLYDKKDRIIEIATYRELDKVEQKSIYKYLSDGVIEINDYNLEGDLKYKTLSKYDINSNKVEESVFLHGNSLLYKDVYKYDTNENLIEVLHYIRNGTEEHKTTYEYNEFDNLGNWIRKTLLTDNRLVTTVVTRDIKYY